MQIGRRGRRGTARLAAVALVTATAVVAFGAGTASAAARPDRPAAPAGTAAVGATGTVDRGQLDVAAPGTRRVDLSRQTVHPDTPSGTVRCDGGCSVNVRSGPSTGYGVVGSVGNGQSVPIYCTARGEWISGYWGATNLWDNIGSGRYISDALVYTGTNNPVAGDCGVSSGNGVNPFAYPWSGVGAGNYVADGHGYYEAECVSFSAWAVRSESHSYSPDFLGNADQWNSHGIPTGGARPGDVPMWDDNHNGAGSLGHVAFVSAVFTDGTIQISEYNWYYAHGYDSRRISVGNPSRYLHFS